MSDRPSVATTSQRASGARTAPWTVALVEKRWAGHHRTYFLEFVRSWWRLGARVLALCPAPDEVRRVLEPELVAAGRAWDDWIIAEKAPGPERSAILGESRDNDPLTVWLRWYTVRRRLDRVEDEVGWRAQLVFFCFLDSYVRYLPLPGAPSLLLGRPWTGLYFHNSHLGEGESKLAQLARGDRLFASSLMAPLGVLDERFDAALGRWHGHPILHFPDVTNEAAPQGPTPEAEALRARAAGRKIIGMISGEKRKGLLTMLKIAEQGGGSEPWFFYCGGTVWLDTFSAEEQAWLKQFLAKAPENVWCDPEGGRPIPDGVPFNTVFASFDVAYCAREQFQGSSNALTKAGLFAVPVLATRDTLTGDRTERYGLGLTITEGSVDEGIAALRQLVKREDGEGRPLAARFADYAHEHALARLDDVFGAMREAVRARTR